MGLHYYMKAVWRPAAAIRAVLHLLASVTLTVRRAILRVGRKKRVTDPPVTIYPLY